VIRQRPPLTIRIAGAKPVIRIGGAKPQVGIKGAVPQVRLKGDWKNDYPTKRR
jgi:hypothetical protein